MEDASLFLLELVEQHWCEPNPETDPSAGGRIRVRINGVTVLDGENDDIGVARTALALSRTLLRDHTREDPVAEQLVLHDCGFATMLMACGIGANWWVRHEGDAVRIDGVVRFDATYGEGAVGTGFSSKDPTEMARYTLSLPHEGTVFPEASCVVLYADYAREIAQFAEAALDFATDADKRFIDDFDWSEWHGWQTEIRETLAALDVRPG